MDRIIKVLPQEIEQKSFEIITQELARRGIVLEGDTASIIKRAIHTTADFEYAESLIFTDSAVTDVKKIIREGAVIVTDTNMTLAGINKKELSRYGSEAVCYMADELVAEEAKARGTTRASISMEKASKLNRPVIFAIGNAPTALISLREMIDEGSFKPAFIIGVPVGFVNVEIAKELIMETDVPYIINKGRKGGSNVAACIVNAVLYQMRDELVQ